MRFAVAQIACRLVIAAGVLSGGGCLLVAFPAHTNYQVDQWIRTGVVDSPDGPGTVTFDTTDTLTEAGHGTSRITVGHTGQHSHTVSIGGRLYRAETGPFEELSIYVEIDGTLPAADPGTYLAVTIPYPNPMPWQASGPELDFDDAAGTVGDTQARSVYFVAGSQGGGDEYVVDHQMWQVVAN